MFDPRITFLIFFISSIWSAMPATAQPLGVFRWQLLPYCNVMTLNVTQLNGVYTLDGTEDRCGAAEGGSASGIAFLNPNGTVGFGIATVLPGGTPLHLEAAITLPSLGGTWRDSAGNSGTLLFLQGAGSGGAPRPIAAVGGGGVPAGSITAVELAAGAVGPAALASGAVGSAALAANSVSAVHIVDASVGSAELANGAVGAATIAANSVTGGHIADGSITGGDLAPAAVGPSALAANAVAGGVGGPILDGSITVADMGDAAKLQSAEFEHVVPLVHLVDQIILETTVAAPAAGRVLLTVSGSFFFDNLTTVDQGLCSLTTGTEVEGPYAGIAIEGTGAGFRRAPFGGTRIFSVAAGSSTTFRLVCVAEGSNLGIASPVLTALFVAGS